jgi:hypothetical protein
VNQLPAASDDGVLKGSICSSPVDNAWVRLVSINLVQQLPVDEIGFHNMVADTLHKPDISLSPVMKPTGNIKHVGSIQGGGLVGSGISLCITYQILMGSDARLNMMLLGMALGP